MDLRGDLKTIKNTLRSNSASSSDSSIEIKPDFGCQVVDNNTCSVCLEKSCNTMLLPCGHQFHAQCIIQWTEQQFSCPMCRSEISHFVPIKTMKHQQEAEFVKLWENHYMAPQPRPPKASRVTKKDPTLAPPSVKTIKRSPSLGKLRLLTREPEECKSCKGTLKNEFVYFAFDNKFCSTPCRLKYARSTMPKKHVFEEGTTSFYVDFSQVMKYMNAKRDEYIDVRSLHGSTDSL